MTTDGLVAYSTRQGDRYSPDVSLRDFSFDGEFRRGFLSHGLGQLTDGIVGGDHFLADLGRGQGQFRPAACLQLVRNDGEL